MMQISSQYNGFSLLSEISATRKTTASSEVNPLESSDETLSNVPSSKETNPAGLFFDSWSQRDKDIFNKLTQDMPGLERSGKIVKMYIVANAIQSANGNDSPYVELNEREFGKLLEKRLHDMTHLAGGVNLEDDIQFLQDFIKLREAGYSSVDTRA